MAREIDLSKGYDKLSREDKLWLHGQGQLPNGVLSEEELRQEFDLSSGVPLEDRANTGTVLSMSTEELEAELARRRAEQGVDENHAKLVDSDEEEGDGEDGYENFTKAQLQALIDERNEGRAEEDLIVPDGDRKAELVAALELDDEE